MHNLSDCFVNVFALDARQHIDSGGRFMLQGYFQGLEHLKSVDASYEYVILQQVVCLPPLSFVQNHDILLRTNSEIVEMLRALNGTNDVEVADARVLSRVAHVKDWSFGAMRLMPDGGVLPLY